MHTDSAFCTVFIPQIWVQVSGFCVQVSEKVELFVYSFTKQQEGRAAN